MKVEIQPINDKGRPLTKALRLKSPAFRGVLRVFEDRMHEFGRVVRCAQVVSQTDGLETVVLPTLLDVELLWMDKAAMRLRGTEIIDGVLFGQTWDVKVLGC